MSNRGLRDLLPDRFGIVCKRRKVSRALDLNLPPIESRNQEGSSSRAGHGAQERHAEQPVWTERHAEQPAVTGHAEQPALIESPAEQPALIDVDAANIDDDVVIISSPRAFAEAKRKSRRNQVRNLVHDLDSGEQTARIAGRNRNKRRSVPAIETMINSGLIINLEGSSNSKRQDVVTSHHKQQPPPPPTFSCPICMGQLVEEMSTKCGHIFCKKCIKAAVSAQGKCPTCRKVITMKDTIRIYLPSAS